MKFKGDKHSTQNPKDRVDMSHENTQQIVSEIMKLCAQGNKWAVQALLEKIDEDKRGLILNTYDTHGDTALTVAASAGHDGLVDYLLTVKGVDPNLGVDKKDFTPLMLAAANGNHEIVAKLLKESTIITDKKNINNKTAAEEALYNSHIKIHDMIMNK